MSNDHLNIMTLGNTIYCTVIGHRYIYVVAKENSMEKRSLIKAHPCVRFLIQMNYS